jgi:hypothetical protein
MKKFQSLFGCGRHYRTIKRIKRRDLVAFSLRWIVEDGIPTPSGAPFSENVEQGNPQSKITYK